MASVGINFGSATSGAGFDVAATVTSILSYQSAVESPWKTQLTALAAQDTALSSIGTDLSALSTAVSALTNLTGVTAQKAGSSSNSNVLQLTGATSSAATGSYSIVVSQLAQTANSISGYFGKTDTLSGNVTIQVGGGTAISVSTTAGDTAATLAAKINTAGAGVTATAVTDSLNTRLSIVSNTVGAAGQLTLGGSLTDSTTSAALNFYQHQVGQDANVQVNGVDYDESSNVVTTVIPGVNFQLLSASNVPVDVQITNDTSSVATAVKTLTTAYNAVVKDLKTQEGKDASGNAEPLYGSPTISLLQSQLSTALQGGAVSGTINNLASLGVSFGTDGTLSVAGDTLTAALTSHFSDVVGFFQSAGSFGLALSSSLNNLGTTGPTGAIYIQQQQNAAQEKALNTNVKNEDALLAAQKITLTAELTLANEELQAIPSQLNQVNEIYSAISGYSKVQQ